MKKKLFSLTFFLLSLLIFADESLIERLRKGNFKLYFLSRTYTKDELDTLLRKGIQRDKVIKIFGEPLIRTSSYYSYQIPPEAKIENNTTPFICGFIVSFDNNKVVDWQVIYREITEKKTISPRAFIDKYKKNFLQKLYTKNDLNKILHKGISKDEVIKIFGKPFISTKADNWSTLTYNINPYIIPKDKLTKYVFSFSLGFENDRLLLYDFHYLDEKRIELLESPNASKK